MKLVYISVDLVAVTTLRLEHNYISRDPFYSQPRIACRLRHGLTPKRFSPRSLYPPKKIQIDVIARTLSFLKEFKRNGEKLKKVGRVAIWFQVRPVVQLTGLP